MRWIKDDTHRFKRRPYYTCDELDQKLEHEVAAFLKERYKSVRYPLSTEDLTILPERHVDDCNGPQKLDTKMAFS